MTQTDTNLVSEAAKIYKVLSNSRRISILFFLRNASKEVDVSTIATTLDLAQPVVSKQLGILDTFVFTQDITKLGKDLFALF